MAKKEEKQEFSIELSEDIALGSYANLALITHSSSEFILDFVRIMPGMSAASVNNRIIMCAEQTKRLLMTLKHNVEQYEKQFGEIHLDKEELPTKIPLSFGTKPTMA